jgi:hypothetical protein
LLIISDEIGVAENLNKKIAIFLKNWVKINRKFFCVDQTVTSLITVEAFLPTANRSNFGGTYVTVLKHSVWFAAQPSGSRVTVFGRFVNMLRVLNIPQLCQVLGLPAE